VRRGPLFNTFSLKKLERSNSRQSRDLEVDDDPEQGHGLGLGQGQQQNAPRGRGRSRTTSGDSELEVHPSHTRRKHGQLQATKVHSRPVSDLRGKDRKIVFMSVFEHPKDTDW
jgi:hypothetical protein